jgi:two-component system LytT family response regulator
MPGYSGFQLLDFFEEINFQVIFTTAHADHALRAFQVSAVDYILKPLQIEQIVRAVKKALLLRGDVNKNGVTGNIMALKENLREGKVSKIGLPMTNGLIFVRPDEIISFSADGAYTKVVLSDGSRLIISKKLKDFEEALVDVPSYFRTHRSHMINIDFVKQFSRKDGGVILLEKDIEVPLAKEKRSEFFDKIDAHLI